VFGAIASGEAMESEAGGSGGSRCSIPPASGRPEDGNAEKRVESMTHPFHGEARLVISKPVMVFTCTGSNVIQPYYVCNDFIIPRKPDLTRGLALIRHGWKLSVF
jgi:hypothetical protein